MNRITAFSVALDYLGVCAFQKFAGEDSPLCGGTLNYLTTLEKKRRETPGLAFVVLVDQRIRKKVHELNTEVFFSCTTFSQALNNVLREYSCFWRNCSLETKSAPARDSVRTRSEAEFEEGTKPSGKGRNARKRQNQRAKYEEQVKSLQSQLSTLKGSSERSRTPPRSSRATYTETCCEELHHRRVPSRAWEALCKVR